MAGGNCAPSDSSSRPSHEHPQSSAVTKALGVHSLDVQVPRGRCCRVFGCSQRQQWKVPWNNSSSRYSTRIPRRKRSHSKRHGTARRLQVDRPLPDKQDTQVGSDCDSVCRAALWTQLCVGLTMHESHVRALA